MMITKNKLTNHHYIFFPFLFSKVSIEVQGPQDQAAPPETETLLGQLRIVKNKKVESQCDDISIVVFTTYLVHTWNHSNII